MEKISIKAANTFCPQALFMYGTNKEDGTPNFGLFCWFSYCWDSELAAMACIGGNKLTKDRIRAEKIFSANLVSESLLPLADYLGNTEGYTERKMNIPIEVERGRVLDVPVLKESPWIFELEVSRELALKGSDVFFCKIRNTLAAKELKKPAIGLDKKMQFCSPVLWTSSSKYGDYFSIDKSSIGATNALKEGFSKH